MPNPLVRAVARLRISIRAKLLIAFLGITMLMTGLALFGLSALQQANARTEALIRDQERISVYYEIYGYMGDLMTLALGSAAFDPATRTSGGSIANNPGVLLADRVGDFEGEFARMRRRLTRNSAQDAERITGFISVMRDLGPVASQVRAIRDAGSLNGVETLVLGRIIPAAQGIQRDTYTVIQTIESRMAATARSTAQAYARSLQREIGAALTAIGVALLMGYAMSSALIWPVRRIGATLQKVANGAFGARVEVPNRDELGTLADGVNAMNAQLGQLYDEVEAQKAELEGWNTELETKVAQQVDEIQRTNRLRRFLPAQVADMIVESDNETSLLDTRRGEITVLFADLRGFTGFSNAMPPAEVIGALNAFHRCAGPVIEAHGGTIERFLGDGLMVLFGAPLAMEDAAQRAVDTALDIQAAMQAALERFRAGPDGQALGLGIGIGTGVATMGQVGFEGRQDYSAIGPAPNLAARLCDKAAAGQIVISHATAWHVTATLEPVGPFDLKGIGTEVAAFEVTGRAEGL